MKGVTKWDRPVGVKLRAGNAPNGSVGCTGWECWWCVTGRPPEFSCDWFDPRCGICQQKAKLKPWIVNAKRPSQLHRERYSEKYRAQRIAAALVGATERVAAYLAKVGSAPRRQAA